MNDVFEIRHVNGHYILTINKIFYGSYDTFAEAANDMEAIKKEKEGVA